MKYFTSAWARGELEDESGTAFAEYKKHLAFLLPQMPPDVRILATNTNLHDGMLLKKVLDTEQDTLLLILRCGDLQVGYFDLELHYLHMPSVPPATEGLESLVANPSRKNLHRSEALYDEVDMEGDVFVHRILFYTRRTYHEVTVRFTQLRLRTTPREDRYDAVKNG
jgi:hypothetical protein